MTGRDADHVILGTWPLNGANGAAAIGEAIAMGYRRIDTAQYYENEAAVGEAIAASGLSDVKVQTKVWPTNMTAELFLPSVEQSLRNLRVEAVDCLLLHWPPRDAAQFDLAVTLLSACVDRGYTRAIGVSNFTAAMIDRAAALSDHPVTVHQLEYHPLIDQTIADSAAARHGITLQAYSPLGQGVLLRDPDMIALAREEGLTVALLVLRWLVQRGVVPVCKASNRTHAADNLSILSLHLRDDVMARIDAMRIAHRRLIELPDLVPDWDPPALASMQ